MFIPTEADLTIFSISSKTLGIAGVKFAPYGLRDVFLALTQSISWPHVLRDN